MSLKKISFILFILLLFVSLSIAGTVYYQYDELGRLTKAEYPGATIEYAYDPAGNRVSKTVVLDADGATTHDWDFNDGHAPDWVDDGSGTWAVSDGVYAMTGNGGDESRFSHYSQELCDFEYQADVRKTAGDSSAYLNGYGLRIRSDGTEENYYQFLIATDGWYTIAESVSGSFTKLADWTFSNDLRTGFDQWNELKIIAAGSILRFYANDQLLETIEDSSLSCGKLGLAAYDASDSDLPDTVEFDNVFLEFLDGPSGKGIPCLPMLLLND